MAAVNDRAYDTDLLDTLSQRVVVVLIHRNYFEAGADTVETKCVRLQSG